MGVGRGVGGYLCLRGEVTFSWSFGHVIDGLTNAAFD